MVRAALDHRGQCWQAHATASKRDLNAYEQYAEPRMVDVATVKLNRAVIGKAFKQEAKAVQEALEARCPPPPPACIGPSAS